VVLSSNYALYGDMSRRVTETLGEFSPHVDIYSIDESFVGFQGFDPATLEERGHRLRQNVGQWTGIPLPVGFAPTRVLAKVANRAAKEDPRLRGRVSAGCRRTRHQGANATAARHRSMGEGVERRTGERLALLGIETAWQLREAVRQHASRAEGRNFADRTV